MISLQIPMDWAYNVPKKFREIRFFLTKTTKQFIEFTKIHEEQTFAC